MPLLSDSSSNASLGIAEKRVSLQRKRIDKYVRLSVVVIVCKVSAHAGEALAVSVERYACLQAHLGECAIAIIPEKLLWLGVICDKNVRPPIKIEIIDGNAKSFARMRCDSGLFGDISKAVIAFVVEEPMGCRRKSVWMTISAQVRLLRTAPGIVFRCPFQISGNEQSSFPSRS